MTSHRVRCLVVALALLAGGLCEARGKAKPMPDLTKGGTKDDKHNWTLGPTGARGWMWGRNLETLDTRQILVTAVAEGSPADGVLQVDDVILGVGGKPFDSDCRKVFGRAITEAEKTENKGVLRLLVWRKGKTSTAQIKLKGMGSYSDTSPWNCAKSAKILDAGLKYIAKQKQSGAIPSKINMLALLASGRKEYLPLVRAYAHEVGPKDLKLKLFGGGGMVAWSWGYTNLFLTEYHLATGDAAVLPAIRELSNKIAMGQSFVGSWGHGMAWPQSNNDKAHGSLGGYGALNQAGLICQTSMALALKCGVKDPEVDKAVAQANRFFGFYIDKGAIPYGDHRPGWQVHDDNGKNSIAAVLFDAQGHRKGAQFFSRMTVGSHGERERGHTGNYFSFLWGPLGANRAGDAAAAAYLRELRWFYDMARGWDGSFRYQGGAGMGGGEHQYGRWDCTGAMILSCTLPLGLTTMTGKGRDKANELTGAKLAETIEPGRHFDSWSMGIPHYEQMDTNALIAQLRSWSPAVRHRAAQALKKKDGNIVAKALPLLDDDSLLARYGACTALGALGAKGAPAVPALIKALSHEDLWLRIQACYALSSIGKPALAAVPVLLKMAATPTQDDPRQFMQRYLCFCLFYPGGALRMNGLIARSLEGVDREQLYAAVRQLLKNDDGRARGAVSSIYKQLSYDEIKPLLPVIHAAIVTPSPSGVMFASGIRLRGLELLAKHRVAEGMPLCISIMDIEAWGKRNRISGCLKILAQYGGSAKPVLPQLRELEKQLLAHREAKGLKPQIDQVKKLIADIENAKDAPKLRSIKL